MLPILGIVSLIFGVSTGLITLAGLVWAYSLFLLIVFIRTGNNAYLIVFAYGVFLGCLLAVLPNYLGSDEIAPGFGLAYFLSLIFFGFVLVYLVVTRKLKWRGREIFELAGESIDDVVDGYTSRPRPVGKVEYSPEQMRDFARFAVRSMIALPYYTSRNITLVPIKMGDEHGRVLGLNGDYRDASWINFDFDGEVSVHIA